MMAASGWLDRCQFLASSGGTADFVVSAASTGFMTPTSAGAVNSAMYPYYAQSSDLTQWEVGYGQWTTSSTTLIRTTILFSSNSNAKVNFTSAPTVSIDVLAEDLAVFNTSRQNVLLNHIYQSKLWGASRRVIECFADGYAGTDGINTGSSSNYTQSATNKNVAPTPATTSVTINTSGTSSVNGSGVTYADRTTAILNSVTVYSLGVYETAAQTIDLHIVLRNSAGNYTTVVSQSFSHPGGGWADCVLTTPYAVPATGTYYVAAYISATSSNFSTSLPSRAHITGDSSGTQTWTEDSGSGGVPVTRYSYITSYNNMTLVTAAQTADTTVSNVRVLIEFDNTNAPTLNIDLTVSVTCNGGANWATAVLSSVGAGQSGRMVAETADTICVGGTSFYAQIQTPSGKNVPIYGVTVSVH